MEKRLRIVIRVRGIGMGVFLVSVCYSYWSVFIIILILKMWIDYYRENLIYTLFKYELEYGIIL